MVAAKALAAQLAAWLLVWFAAPLVAARPSVLALALAQGVVAAALSAALRSDRWWPPIHLAFSPALVAVQAAQIPPLWFLAAFVVLLAVYWTPFRTRVPLYLSNRVTARAVARLLPAGARVIDLGSGTGTLLRRCAIARPDCLFTGVESAPLPYLISRWRCANAPNVVLRRADLWEADLGQYDVIYAFLSPEPMARLERKLERELGSGALFVSNSFPLPERPPAGVLELPDRRRTRLYCYRGQAPARSS